MSRNSRAGAPDDLLLSSTMTGVRAIARVGAGGQLKLLAKARTGSSAPTADRVVETPSLTLAPPAHAGVQ
jgi:hypothetical protein